MSRRFRATLLVAAALSGAAACGSSSTPVAKRPSTTARIEIVAPTSGETVPRNTRVVIKLIGAHIVRRSTGPLTPTEGHVHVLVDGKVVAMAFKATQPLTGLAPGAHTLQAQFVAVDHFPFAPPVVAVVVFNVA